MAKLNLRRLLAASTTRALRTCFVHRRQRNEEDVEGSQELDKKYNEYIARELQRRCEEGDGEEDDAEPSEPVVTGEEAEEEEDMETFNKKCEDAIAVFTERVKREEANLRYLERRPKLGRVSFVTAC